MYSTALLHWLVSSSRFLKILEDFLHRWWSCLWIESSFLNAWSVFLLFLILALLSWLESPVNANWRRQLCLILSLEKNTFSFLPLCMILSHRILFMPFIRKKKFPLIPSLPRDFIRNKYRFFSMFFLHVFKNYVVFLLESVHMMKYLDFWMLNNLIFLG